MNRSKSSQRRGVNGAATAQTSLRSMSAAILDESFDYRIFLNGTVRHSIRSPGDS